jgi:hypothetical protein
MEDTENRTNNVLDGEIKEAQRKLKNNLKQRKAAGKKKAGAEAAKDVCIAELQAKNTTDATKIEKLVFSRNKWQSGSRRR